jgi:aromatic ring hydroxylase
MGAEDRAYAVAFAVPANAKGLRLVASPYGSHKKNAFEHPISAQHKMMETLTIFEDVFVPAERIFLKGEWQYAGPLAKTFVEFHRFTAVSYKLPLLDLLVGAAQLMVEYNGIERAGHVREKMSWLIAYGETVRALTRLAALDCKMIEPGIAVPNTFLVNMAKLHFATGYHQALMHVQDLTGGLLVTGPGEEDLRNPETGDLIRRLFGGKKGIGGEDRLRAINLVQDLTAGDFGGYQAVLAIHAEGSIEAEKLTMYREFDLARVKAYAKQIAGIGR